jgi:hypothetical protein
MWAAQSAGDDVVEGKRPHFATAILAGVIVSTKDLALGKGDAGPRALDHVAQFDHGGNFMRGRGTTNHATTVDNDFCFSGEYQSQCPLCTANVYWFECHVQYEYWLFQ